MDHHAGLGISLGMTVAGNVGSPVKNISFYTVLRQFPGDDGTGKSRSHNGYFFHFFSTEICLDGFIRKTLPIIVDRLIKVECFIRSVMPVRRIIFFNWVRINYLLRPIVFSG
jgi:hypothetical protein